MPKHELGFTDYETEFLYVCDICGATVSRDNTERHREWHRKLNELLIDD